MNPRVKSSLVAVGCVACTVSAATNARESALGASGARAAGCEVTKAVHTENPQGNEGWYIVQEGLFVFAGENSTYAAQRRNDQSPEPPGTYPLLLKRDGSIVGKVPWFRDNRANGELKVRAIRRPGGDRARGSYSNHLGPRSDVIPGAMRFTRKGCWDIKATSGDSTLEATVRVIEVK